MLLGCAGMSCWTDQHSLRSLGTFPNTTDGVGQELELAFQVWPSAATRLIASEAAAVRVSTPSFS